MIAQAARDAHADGGPLHGDTSMSGAAVGAFKKAASMNQGGSRLEMNPNAEHIPETAPGARDDRWVSDDPRKPVVSLYPNTPEAPLGRRIFGGKQAGYTGNPYESAKPAKDVWGSERVKNDRTNQPAAPRSNNPYDNQPLGARIGGGKQRGAVGALKYHQIESEHDAETAGFNAIKPHMTPAEGAQKGGSQSKATALPAAKNGYAFQIKGPAGKWTSLRGGHFFSNGMHPSKEAAAAAAQVSLQKHQQRFPGREIRIVGR
jgi:hypothetical protein